MEYRDKITGAVILSESELGGDWELVKPAKTKKKTKEDKEEA